MAKRNGTRAGGKSTAYRAPLLEPDPEWSVEHCLRKLADLIFQRVQRWKYPPADEEDDERPDYPDILSARHYFTFDRPLSEDLGLVEYERARIWLKAHFPAVGAEVNKKVKALAAALGSKRHKSDALIKKMAITAWFLKNVASTIKKSNDRDSGKPEPPKDKKTKTRGGQQRYDPEDDRRKNDQLKVMLANGASLTDAARQLETNVKNLKRLQNRVRFHQRKERK